MQRSSIFVAVACLTLCPAMPAWTQTSDDGGAGTHGLHFGTGDDTAICSACHTVSERSADGSEWPLRTGTAEYQISDGGGIAVISDVTAACLYCHDGSEPPETAAADFDPAAYEIAPKLRREMIGEHPVGLPFPLSAAGALPDYDGRLQSSWTGTMRYWWLDLEPVPNASRERTDLILYTREDDAGAQPYIECATCHDPHTQREVMYLRDANADSALCLACHRK